VCDIEAFRRQAAAQAHDGTEAEWRQFEAFGGRALGEAAANGANDQLTVVPFPKAARERQQ
jgi:hypothetical protein